MAGVIGKLLDFVRGQVDGAHVSDAVIDPGGGANLSAQHFSSPGDDARPLPGDYVATAPSPGTGNEHAVGYIDPANPGIAEAGEKRIYSRGDDGAVIAVVWLKNDGTIVIENDSGEIQLEPGGKIVLNGVEIDASGNISTPGSIKADLEITAKALTPASQVTVSQHLHAGIGSPPTPGT